MANTHQFFSSQDQDDITVVNMTRVSQFPPSTSSQPTRLSQHQRVSQSSDNDTAMIIDGEEEEEDRTRRTDHGEASSPSSTKAKVNCEEETKRKIEESGINMDALFCPICMDPWTTQGDHQVSCLPCGHLYGMSCISRWIQHHGRRSAKCPQCNASCMLKDIRKLYASPVVVVDEGLRKKVESLEAEIGSLKSERANLIDVQDNLLNVQDNLLKALHQLKEKPASLENVSLGEMGRKPHRFFTAKEVQEGKSGHIFGSGFGRQGSLRCHFVLEHELVVEGARLFDMDACYQVLILARRISGMGGIHMLNKINLIYPHENEDIQLPPSTRAVKDLRVSPCGRLTLLASLGKKLSILSMGSNNVVLTYDLPGPAWSCSWDLNCPHYIYAGLQNGMLLMFDMRQTVHSLESMDGLTSRPIHTIHSLVHNPTLPFNGRKLLTASSVGPCVWSTSDARERPFLVPGLENHGICTSLAYSPSSDNIVASYCPKVETSNAVPGRGILGSQVLVKRVAGSFYHNLGSAAAHLSDVQMKKSGIINVENCMPVFAYGDEVTHGLRLRELPSLTISQNLKPHQQPILDVKYAYSRGPGLLGCISDDKLQIFSAKVL